MHPAADRTYRDGDGAGGSAVMAKKARSGSESAPDCQRERYLRTTATAPA